MSIVRNKLNNPMKTNLKLYLLAVSAAALSLNITTVSAQLFDAADVAKNSAVANSPRAIEVFPWLARRSATPAVAVKPSSPRTALADVAKNRAFASSPRTLEQFPELARTGAPSRRLVESSVPSNVAKNHAFVASPRVLEEYPELARGRAAKPIEKTVEIAPIK